MAETGLYASVAALDDYLGTVHGDASLRRLLPSVVVPLGGIIGAEALLAAGVLPSALLLYVLLLVYCSLAPLRLPGETPTFLAVVLLPVFRLVNLAMPAFAELTLYWLPLVYAPMLVAIAIVVRSSPLLSPAVGWKIGLMTLPIAVLTGILLGQIEYVLRPPDGLVPAFDAVGATVLGLVMVGVVAVVEEALFRGVLQRTLEQRLGAIGGLLVASGLFAVMYAGLASAPVVGLALGLGLLYGVVFQRTGSLLVVIAMHGTANVFLYGVFPLTEPLIALSVPG